MDNKRRNNGALIGGVLLIAFGILSLFSQLFQGFEFWPFIVIGVGAMFFVGMVAGGRSTAALAIPGSIISVIGIMLFLQNVTGYWESWAYGWTVILMAVGLGIYIMGWWDDSPSQRASGLRVARIGAILFLIFGGFFETLFHSFAFSAYIFPIVLILFGVYILYLRFRPSKSNVGDDRVDDISQTM